MLTLATSRTPGRFVVRDCFNCIEARNPPAFCQRCDGCIDDEDRPNWTPKNAADLEYLSWFPAHVVGAAPAQPGPTGSEGLHETGFDQWAPTQGFTGTEVHAAADAWLEAWKRATLAAGVTVTKTTDGDTP